MLNKPNDSNSNRDHRFFVHSMTLDALFALRIGASEVYSIKICDIDFKKRRVIIRRNETKEKEPECSQTSLKSITVDRRFLDHVKRFLMWKKTIGEGTEPEDPFICINEPTSNGKWIDRPEMIDRIRQIEFSAERMVKDAFGIKETE